jgi:hypothetical protein
MKKRAFDTIKHLKLKKVDRISERTRGVHQIFQRKIGHGRPGQLADVFAINCQSTPRITRIMRREWIKPTKQRTRPPEFHRIFQGRVAQIGPDEKAARLVVQIILPRNKSALQRSFTLFEERYLGNAPFQDRTHFPPSLVRLFLYPGK